MLSNDSNEERQQGGFSLLVITIIPMCWSDEPIDSDAAS